VEAEGGGKTKKEREGRGWALLSLLNKTRKRQEEKDGQK